MSSTTVKTIGQPSVVLAQAAPIDMVKEESSNAIAEDQIQKQPAVVVVAVSTEIESSKAQEQIPIDMVEEPSKVIAEVQDQVAGIPAAVVEEPSNAIAEDQIQEQPAVVVVAVSTEIESSKAQEQIPIDMVEEPSKVIAEVQDQALSSSSENKRKSSENQTANVEESQSPAKKAKTAEEMDALMADCGSPTPTCGC